MCKGINDKGGPLRCAGHARESLTKAAAAHAEASATAHQNSIEIATLPTAIQDASDDWHAIENRRIRLFNQGDAEGAAAAREESNAILAASSRLDRDLTARKAEQKRLDHVVSTKADALRKAQAEYDATDRGLIDLQHDTAEAYERMWVENDTADDSQRKVLEARYRGLQARLNEAEHKAWSVGAQRNGAWDGDYEMQEHAHAIADGTHELTAARELEAAATTDEERTSARIARESAESFMVSLRERERTALSMRPKVASFAGQADDAERERWGRVVSGHRRNIDPKDGSATFEITVDRRDNDGQQHTAKLEVRESEFTPELLDAYRREMPEITRMPSTTEVIRWAETSSSKLKGHASRKDFLAAGGTATDWDHGQNATKALKSLSLA